MFTDKVDIRIEVEQDALVLILPKPMTDLMMPWQDAMELGSLMQEASREMQSVKIEDPVQVRIETEQVRIGTHNDRSVFLLFAHTDRLRFSYRAARIVATAIRTKAQDLELLERRVKMTYNKYGQPRPYWLEPVKKVFGPAH